MNSRQPMIPVRQWQSDGYFARVQVTVGSEYGWADRQRFGPVSPEQEGKRIEVVAQYPFKSCTRRPIRYWLCIQSGPGLVRGIPGSPWIGKRKRANVAGNLPALQFGKPVK